MADPFKVKTSATINSTSHALLKFIAKEKNMTINEYVSEAIERQLQIDNAFDAFWKTEGN